MKEKPILMSGEMVRAILDNRKNQTRRVIKLDLGLLDTDKNDRNYLQLPDEYGEYHKLVDLCPYGKVGDRLWVRETHIIATQVEGANVGKKEIWYKATPPAFLPVNSYKWRPSIHIPRWASRITLEITDIRVERNEEGIWEWVIDFKVIKK